MTQTEPATAARTIRPAGPEDTDRLCGLLAEAFQDDPLTAWILPDPAERAAALPAFFRVFVDLSLAHGGVLVGGVGGDFAAVLLYLSPAGWEEAQERDEDVQRRLAEAVGSGTAALFTILAMQAAHHPSEEPQYYASFGAVRPGEQQGGWMTEMLGLLVDRADAEGVPTYVEASSPGGYAVSLRNGFAPLGAEIRLPDGPVLRPMWRPARRSGA
ncbi:hypothetical protein L6E12_05075 [Actinokineospora sp. PR83]|uniref:hypothetical protein n=1 Tax=Actinokineospora sp. PR83 TaxID=2884908 RepID=UPI001F274A17|nr:hypothetical protein [Actinokineospora sp. PR83]MCG8915161.1 hypothetical protein [Actinokineospora sp. PR83]